MTKQSVAIHWFRRDLRLVDNASLYSALRGPVPVLPLFIFDTDILNKLEDKEDARVTFIHNTLEHLQEQLSAKRSGLLVKHGTVLHAWKELLDEYDVKAVYANYDYEPQAVLRDQQVADLLHAHGIPFHSYKDQAILDKKEVLKDNGEPYTVFTPYKNKWLSKLSPFHLKAYPAEKYFHNFLECKTVALPSITAMGFERSRLHFPAQKVEDALITHYAQRRDIPGIHGTSRLGLHLRFGTVSIRALALRAQQLSDVWLNELIWRDFYMMILWHFPHAAKSSFKPQYEAIRWRNNEAEFERWCAGTTGYPIVDAGMRELNETGFMHNRVRMITASFLVKHLLIDWRWGESYFARCLLDFDLSANNGGWQWAAGSGCDAAPYFRIFNPYEQTRKFDPKLSYIRQWVPEIDELTYPAPIVDHKFARERVLKVYKEALTST